MLKSALPTQNKQLCAKLEILTNESHTDTSSQDREGSPEKIALKVSYQTISEKSRASEEPFCVGRGNLSESLIRHSFQSMKSLPLISVGVRLSPFNQEHILIRTKALSPGISWLHRYYGP